MRIIAGRFRRRLLKSPPGKLTRPSTDRVREAVFNLIESRIDLEGARVLDLFAGTGALGLEALSRGAETAVFVEKNPSVLRIVRENADLLGAAHPCLFLCADAVAYLKRPAVERFDVIFADPPYGFEEVQQLPDLARPFLSQEGLFVLEHDAGKRFDDNTPGLETSRAYGRTIVSIFRS